MFLDKRYYHNSTHPWKIIFFYLIDIYLVKSFKFQSNLHVSANKIKRFLIICKQMFKRWNVNLSLFLNLSLSISSQVIWYCKCIKVNSKTIYHFKMSRKDVTYIGQLIKFNGKPKLWKNFKNEFDLRANFSLYLTK